MNERIRELLSQAGVHYEVMPKNTVYEKFAELIVRECAKVVDRGDGEMSSMDETIWCNVCRDDILKHFGVEE